jgi:predicted DNA-binding transcriptional regulator YafY
MIDRNVRHRFFHVLRLLFEETNEDHALSVNQILERLAMRFGTAYKLERRAIYKDLETLIDCGIPIESITGRSNQKFYYWEVKPFERHELQLLLQAVYSARFISQQDTETLVDKLRKLAGKVELNRQQERMKAQERVKTVFGSLRSVMRNVELAIAQSRQLVFRYGKWNAEKQFIYRHGGADYVVSPYAIAWVNDFYYLIAKPEGEETVKHYRLDRMREVRSGALFRGKPFDLANYLKQAFQMHGGEVAHVFLRIEEELVPVIFDRLGLDVQLTPVGSFDAEANVAFSKEFDPIGPSTGDFPAEQAEQVLVDEQAEPVARSERNKEREIPNLADIEDSPDGKQYDVRFEGAVSDGLVRWILSLGPKVEVMGPPELRTRVQEMVAILASKYNT